MEVAGDLFSGAGAFESEASVASLVSIPASVDLLIESGDSASQGESWLEATGEPVTDGSIRLAQ